MSRPRVSVIVPTYNNEATLARSLDSLAAQDYPNFHVVIIDDCSTDASFRMALEYAAANSAFRAVRNERNLGAVGNYAAGKRFVEGEFFLIGGPDDTWGPEFISRMVTLLQERPKAAAAISSICSQYSDGETEIYRYPELNTSFRDRPLKLGLSIMNGIARDGRQRSPYYSIIHALVRSPYYSAVFSPDRRFWHVELQLVTMYALLGGIATTDEALYTRHRFRQSWSERYPADALVREAEKSGARFKSTLVFLRHVFAQSELSLLRKLYALPIFASAILFQILRPALAPKLKAMLPSGLVTAIRSVLYKFF